ncbi:hypothetical protein [Natrialba swarupiae]|uniref:hypothetical protein n=1 Tax=Natrialba swarupiae TaxID=2448032 RepID=UPI00192E6D82|nr:hypothetical protein [Natrialba swarupiae]
MVSTATKITGVFIVIAVILWYASLSVTENTIVQAAVLLGVGVVIPTLINEIRSE